MNKYWIWFSRINKIGAKAQYKLLEKYETPENIWSLDENELKETLTQEQIKIVMNNEYKENLEKYMEYMKKHGIKMITINDKKYPYNLRNIYDPPVVLYLVGNENTLNNSSIAIIGSRLCSSYGKMIAKQFVEM